MRIPPKVALIVAEIAAIAILRVVYVMRREPLPKGSKVEHVKGKPVYGFPFLTKKEKRAPAIAGWQPPPKKDQAAPRDPD